MSQDGLLSKFTLLSLLPLDRRVGRKHLAVYGFILDWHHRKYGDALASVRHIVGELKSRDPFGKGLYMGDVHAALVDLVAWGYLTQEKGSGRRASRYVPVWTVFDSVRGTPNTTEQSTSVRETPNADVRETPNATVHSVPAAPNEDPSTLTRVQDTGTGRLNDYAETLAGGPKAAAALAKIGGFDELWRAYAYRKDKATARAAYNAMHPDADQHGEMVLAANAWRDAWAAQDNPSAYRKTLANWLRDECWDCDPPSGFVQRSRQRSHDNDNEDIEVEMINDVGPFSPFGSFHGEITKIGVAPRDEEGLQSVEIELMIENERIITDVTHTLKTGDGGRGDEQLRELLSAANKEQLVDLADLIGHWVRVEIDERLAIHYRAA